MSLKKILLAISLMAVVAFMGAASACPCSNVPVPNQWDLGQQPVGVPICITAPSPPSGETWGYQWEVYIGGQWKLLSQLPYNGVTYTLTDHTLCVTPSWDQCGQTMGARVTITTTTDLQTGYWDGCILLLCVQWECYNPDCPTMTSFCQQQATAANLPQGESSAFTYTYAIVELGETAPGSAMTVPRLNALAPGTYHIKVYTTQTGTQEICEIIITVYAKPTGGLTGPLFP